MLDSGLSDSGMNIATVVDGTERGREGERIVCKMNTDRVGEQESVCSGFELPRVAAVRCTAATDRAATKHA